ncbi:MAG: hypothetical protein AAF081_17935 [Actinomycetota bacterium]
MAIGCTSVTYIAGGFGFGITDGTSDTTYGPAHRVSRRQMAAFIGRLYRAAIA